jgi:MFS family permease
MRQWYSKTLKGIKHKLESKIPSFSRFLFSRFFATVGIKMVPALLGWYIYDITGSAFAIGILGLCEVLPAIGFALPAGVYVDRTSRIKTIKFSLLSYMMVLVLLLMLTLELVQNIFSPTWIALIVYILVAVTGWIRAYYSPAASAILSQLVDSDFLVKAATSSSMAWLSAAIAGPLIGGLMIGFGSITVAFEVAIFFIALSYFIFITVDPIMDFVPRVFDRTWTGVREGLDFVFSQRALLSSMSLDMFAVLFGGAVALLPVFAKDVLHAGPEGYGMLAAATYFGNFLALMYFYKFPIQKNQGVKLIWSVAGFGLCILIFAISKNIWISFLALVISGLFDGVSMVVRSTIFQILVPEDMRGRVSSVSSVFINSSNELGQFESGLAARLMGIIPSVIFGGTMTILIALFTYVKSPSLRKLNY